MAEDMLNSATAWLAEQFADHASRKVRYERDGSFGLLDATLGRTEYQENDGEGVVTKWTDCDFIFPAEQLALGGKRTEPQEGDEVHVLDKNDSITRTYEVMPIPDQQCFRYCDSFRHGIRVHAKLTGET